MVKFHCKSNTEIILIECALEGQLCSSKISKKTLVKCKQTKLSFLLFFSNSLSFSWFLAISFFFILRGKVIDEILFLSFFLSFFETNFPGCGRRFFSVYEIRFYLSTGSGKRKWSWETYGTFYNNCSFTFYTKTARKLKKYQRRQSSN